MYYPSIRLELPRKRENAVKIVGLGSTTEPSTSGIKLDVVWMDGKKENIHIIYCT
jgi:hypothetical protein